MIFATDRPMGFYELSNSTRSADYDFMLCEIHLGPDGKGMGKLATAAKISYDKDLRKVEIENFGIEPVRLTEARREVGGQRTTAMPSRSASATRPAASPA